MLERGTRYGTESLETIAEGAFEVFEVHPVGHLMSVRPLINPFPSNLEPTQTMIGGGPGRGLRSPADGRRDRGAAISLDAQAAHPSS